MKALDSINVVRLNFAHMADMATYLVMDYCNGGNLDNFILVRGGFLPEPEVKLILR